MEIFDKIKEKTRDEYVEMVKLYLARLSGKIQQQPLSYFVGALGAGIIIVLFSKIVWPLILLACCVALMIYFIAPVSKIH